MKLARVELLRAAEQFKLAAGKQTPFPGRIEVYISLIRVPLYESLSEHLPRAGKRDEIVRRLQLLHDSGNHRLYDETNLSRKFSNIVHIVVVLIWTGDGFEPSGFVRAARAKKITATSP